MSKIQPEQAIPQNNQQPSHSIQLVYKAKEPENPWTDVLMNYERSAGVPGILKKQGVPEDLWLKTYTVVTKYCVNDARIQRKTRNPLLYPLVKLNQSSIIKQWDHLVPRIQSAYDPFGIQLSLVHDGESKGVLGIRFDVVKPVRSESSPATSIRPCKLDVRVSDVTVSQELIAMTPVVRS